jgi:hypothetical protein
MSTPAAANKTDKTAKTNQAGLWPAIANVDQNGGHHAKGGKSPLHYIDAAHATQPFNSFSCCAA